MKRPSAAFPLGFVLLCALSLTLTTLVLTNREERTRVERAPVRAEPERSVPAFVGHRPELPDTAPVRARLTRLHADPARQAFDARVLRERLGLGLGEPWRLELTHEGGPDSEAVALGDLGVEDHRGRALAALRPARGGPLAALFGPPPGHLQPGRSTQLVLWGRAPETQARLVGLGQAQAAESPADAGLALAPAEVPSGTLPQSLAKRPAKNRGSENGAR